MSSSLPPNLLRFFEARPPLPFKQRSDHAQDDRRTASISGIAEFMPVFKEGFDADYTGTQSHQERKRERIQRNRQRAIQERDRQLAEWNPQDSTDGRKTHDPFKTLFVARLASRVTQQVLEREFGRYGKCAVKMVQKKNTLNPERLRTYAFVEFEHERDMLDAQRDLDRRKIEGRRIIVDVERGRTVKDWKPRRLGGGLGGWKQTMLEQLREQREISRRGRMNARRGGPPKRHRDRSQSPGAPKRRR